MNVPLVNLKPALTAAEPVWRANLERLIESAHFILGEELACFEREFAEEMNAGYAIGTGSGAAAIELCLREAGATSRDCEVITTPLTAPFTGVAVLAAGASIRFADIDSETLLIDPAAAADAVNSRTAAILPVHLYGQPCDLDGLAALGLPLIQDACQAHGTTFRGRPFTHYSPWVAYSFYPTKNLGALGDGGAVVTSGAAIAKRLSMLRDGGRDGHHVSALPGINSRLDDMQCCFLRAFLPHLREWNAMRARLAGMYDRAFERFEPVRPVLRREQSVNHLYVVRAHNRDGLREHLTRKGIGTGIHYPVPLHLQPAFAHGDAQPGSCPNAEQACGEILSLPMWPHLRDEELACVVSHVKSFY